jgi:polyisoprenoid-binding protein YceI
VALGYRLTITSGSRAAYRVKERLLGIDFPNDAVGMTQSVKGSVLLRPDGSLDSGQSKLTVDLRTMSSDQEHRDEYINTRTLSVDKYPLLEFLPRRITGLPAPLPYRGQHGIEVVGDMTLRGVTREVNWKGVVSYEGPTVGGRLVTNFNFALFALPIPQAPARVLSVEDNIVLEVDFKMLRGE